MKHVENVVSSSSRNLSCSRLRLEQLLRIFRALQTSSLLHKSHGASMTDLLIDWFVFVILRYDQSEDGLEEVITVREMINPNDPVKNVIITLSDLHLDSIWCLKEAERIAKFIEDLTKISKVRIEEISVFTSTELLLFLFLKLLLVWPAEAAKSAHKINGHKLNAHNLSQQTRAHPLCKNMWNARMTSNKVNKRAKWPLDNN